MGSRCGATMVWAVLALAAATLGYSAVSRFDPTRTPGLRDTATYYGMVRNGLQQSDERSNSRVLVPVLARLLYLAINGRTGTWDPAGVSLLAVNATFCATCAWLLWRIAGRLGGGQGWGLVAALLWLVNFAVSNGQLSGLVDSGEALAMMVAITALMAGRWSAVPAIIVVGALAKETFVPLAAAFAGSWAAAENAPSWPAKSARLAWVGAGAVMGLGVVLSIRWGVSGQLMLPWEFVSSEKGPLNPMVAIVRDLTSRGFWYVLLWLLPLGLVRVRRFSHAWLAASVAAALVAVLLGGWRNSEGNVARALFTCTGPILTLSAAHFLADVRSSDEASSVA